MNRKILFISVSLILIILLGIGVSYSLWNITVSQDKVNTAYTECFDVSITSENNNIDLENTYPITNEKGKKLTPYSFTITNTCDIFTSYTVNLESLKSTTLPSKFLNVMINNEEIKKLSEYESTDILNSGSLESHILAKGSLGSGDSADYTLRLWIDYGTTMEDLDNETKIFKSKVTVLSQPSNWNPKDAGYDTLHDAILANEYQTTPEIAKQKIAGKQAVDVTNTAPIIKWVEKTGSTSTRQVIKPTEDAISSVSQLIGINANEQYMYICTTKSFNSDTARYSLSGCSLKDPTTLDYSGDTKYYYSTEYMTYNQTTQKLYVARNTGDITVYKITGATKSTSTQTTNSISYATNVYNLSCTTLTETELESDKSDKGIYQATDDYGTTYYYRGNVKNNIVKFAGFYWQIVRINGDGSIRLIYDGTEKNATGVNQSINNETYQFNNKYNDPAYIGYMYGNPDATTFDEVHTNTTSSPIKTNIDTWYKTNIVDKGYSSYVSNAVGFCGDRSLYSGNGISTSSSSYFGAYGRYAKNTAQFTCPELSRDLYTTADSSVGNKTLTYPVGLITYDELVFAGMDRGYTNKLSWAYSTQHYWTMSPSRFYATTGYAYEWVQNGTGYLSPLPWVTYSHGTRPVINIRPDVKISGGTGTSNDPFVIETSN